MEIRKQSLEIAERASRATDEALQRDARRMLARINARPMNEILDKVPGDTVPQKAAYIGVSRITLWYWIHGYNRPRDKAARRIAKITGFSVDEIRGRA